MERSAHVGLLIAVRDADGHGVADDDAVPATNEGGGGNNDGGHEHLDNCTGGGWRSHGDEASVRDDRECCLVQA